MSTWKKVLLKGLDLTGADVSNNTSDIVGGTGISVTASSGSTDNRLLGNDDDITFAVDVNGLTDLGGAPATDDFIIVHDTSESVNPKVKKVSVTNLSATFDSGVSSLQLKGTSGTTGTADTGAVVFQINGGTGISTVASDDADNGKIVINANVATTGAQGIAQFSSDNFDVNTGTVTIKAQGVEGAEIKNDTITDTQINSNAAIAAGKLGDINVAGKVKFNSLDFNNADVLDGSLAATDFIIVDEGSSGDGTGNHKATLSQLGTFLASSSQVANIDTMHSGVGANQTITGSGITFVKSITVDANGHVTAVGDGSVQNATGSQSGIVSTGTQTFAGDKTFSNNVSVGTNLTVTGNLTVNGTTTTVNTTNLEVADKDIVLAVPSSAYAATDGGNADANTAADEAGIILQSHSGTDVAKFAALTWDKTGDLSGWKVRDTATYSGDDPANDAAQADVAIAVMQFKAGAAADGTDFGAGAGSFLYDSSNDELYFRTA